MSSSRLVPAMARGGRQRGRQLLVEAVVVVVALGCVIPCRTDAESQVPEPAAPAAAAAASEHSIYPGLARKEFATLHKATAPDEAEAEAASDSTQPTPEGSHRDARFLPWTTVTRGGGGGVHPTMATFTHRASQLSDILRRAAKFLSTFAAAQEEDTTNNEIDVDSPERKEDRDDDSPSSALSGLYSECVLRLSVPCVQRKLLLFLDRLGRMERFRVLGDFLTVVRVEPRSGETRRHFLDEDDDVTDLSAMADRLVDDFFDTHVLRFSLPGTLRQVARSARTPATTIDLHFDRTSATEEKGVVEGRGQISLPGGGGNSKKKQKMIKKIKKKLMKLLMMLMSVLMVMGPMTGGMAGGTAMTAMLLGTLSMIIMKILVIHRLGGSVSGLFSNIGSSLGNLAGIPGGGGSSAGASSGASSWGQSGTGAGTSYQPSGTGGGPYARSDYAETWAGRTFGGSFFGEYDPMALAYNAYRMASYLK